MLTKEEYQAAMNRIKELTIGELNSNSAEWAELNTLADQAQHYEKVHFPFDIPTEAELAEFRRKELIPEAVTFVHATPDAESLIAYCARVSSPNQENPDYAKLLRYCIKNQHWSIFEMATMCVEITTSRAIAQQILRHRSFSFQEFSQRYAAVTDNLVYEARRQDSKNRQNSIDDLSPETKEWFFHAQNTQWEQANQLYQAALEKGIAKECARFLLPLSVQTKLYMHGSLRSWIHYLELRTAPGTQKEHRDIALSIREIFNQQFPSIAAALENE